MLIGVKIINKQKVLVAVANYPDCNGNISLMYVHVRNEFYLKHGIDITVLNFATRQDYFIDGIRVIKLTTYIKEMEYYNILICHAANLRNHYIFLKLFGKKFSKFIFFFHGHEVLKVNQVYPPPYPYMKKARWKVLLQNVYDYFKIEVWKRYYLSVNQKSKYVFVSKWMLDEFFKCLEIPYGKMKDNCMITYNSIAAPFEKATFDSSHPKTYDFVTIRGNIDGSKYCVDIVNDLANQNPNFKFLLIGKGDYFKYNRMPKNLEWRNQTLRHDEIISLLNQCRCALMPTRTDAQGLMMCEIASTGMPLITSDIPVCHEVVDEFENVAYINNEICNFSLSKILETLEEKKKYKKVDKFFSIRTSKREVDLIYMIINSLKNGE